MKRLLLTICALFLSCAIVFGQYKQHRPLRDYYTQKMIGNERFLQRINVGIGVPFFPGKMDLKYKGLDTLGDPVSYSGAANIQTKRAGFVHVGTYFPISLITDKSMLTFNIDVIAGTMELWVDSVEFTAGSVYKSKSPINTICVPISFDYKSGADVTLDKNDKSMFSFGAGFNFYGYNNYKNIERDLPFKVIPFVKAEIGFVAGLAYKIRGMAHLGKADFIDRYTENVISPNKSDELYSKSNTGFGFNLSLIVMPFSYSWTTY